MERESAAVMRDVEDDYVSLERAELDYGVVLKVIDTDLAHYEVDARATKAARREIAKARRSWLAEDPEAVAERYRKGEINSIDMVRRYAVIVDWGSGELMPKTTEQFRASTKLRTSDHWNDSIAELGEAAE